MKDDPLPILLGFVLIALTLATCFKMEHTENHVLTYVNQQKIAYVTIQDSAFIAQSPHYVEKFVTLASLVDCLCWEETKDNPDAINWNDWHLTNEGIWEQGSFGCMQFSKSTFREFCIEGYKLAQEDNDVFDCGVSRQCAKQMVDDGYGERWSTWYKCN